MAALTATKRSETGDYVVTVNTLTASDTLAFTNGSKQHLVLFNTTASPVVVTLKGNSATSFTVSGYGSVDVSAGKVITVGANATRAVVLDTIAAYLAGGNVAVTGGTGLTAVIHY